MKVDVVLKAGADAPVGAPKENGEAVADWAMEGAAPAGVPKPVDGKEPKGVET